MNRRLNIRASGHPSTRSSTRPSGAPRATPLPGATSLDVG